MRLIAENDAMQCPGFWWCACGRISSPDMFGGLRSLGVCVELLVTVVTSSPFVPSLATGDVLDFTGRNIFLLHATSLERCLMRKIFTLRVHIPLELTSWLEVVSSWSSSAVAVLLAVVVVVQRVVVVVVVVVQLVSDLS